MKILRRIFFWGGMFALGQLVHAAQPSGYVIEWGWNTPDGLPAPATLVASNITAISAGRFHCLALKSDGMVIRWGGNALGRASFANSTEPKGDGSGGSDNMDEQRTTITNGIVKIDGRVLRDISSVAAGDLFSIALKQDGTVIGWGKDSVPVGPSNVVAIAAADSKSLAVKNDGTVIWWTGAKRFPECGLLTEVSGFSNVIAVATSRTAFGTRDIALKKDGTVVHWGTESIYKEATPPVGLSNVVTITVGRSHTLAVKQDSTVIGWGGNDVGQATGIPTTKEPSISSGQVVLEGNILSNVVAVAANAGYSMALKKDGTVVAWGKMVNNLYPATVPEGLRDVIAIAAGENFCLAITTNPVVAERFRQK